MAASVATPKRLDGDKAQRIIEAMRNSVATRGAAGSTFDHVAREAGVSRGLLHYYFGSKEQLLVEVVRHDCELRLTGMGARIARATTADEIIAALVLGLEEFIEGEPGSPAVIYELLSASRHSEDIRAELAELYRRWRADLADSLRAKEREGVVAAGGRPGVGRVDAVRAGRRLRHPGALGSRVGSRGRLRAGRADRAPAARRGRVAPRVERLPHWERGTPVVLCAAGPHPIPVSTAIRAGDDRILLALGRRREALRRLRAEPGAALLVMGEGVAFTAFGDARVVSERMEAADTIVAVELRVEPRPGPPRRRPDGHARRRALALDERRPGRRRRGDLRRARAL